MIDIEEIRRVKNTILLDLAPENLDQTVLENIYSTSLVCCNNATNPTDRSRFAFIALGAATALLHNSETSKSN